MLDWFVEHHGVFILIAGGLLVLLIRSVIRALQRWEIIPDPLLPERWRRVVNKVEEKALEASADPKTYGRIAGAMRGGGSGSSGGDFKGGGGSMGGGGASGSF